MRRSRLEQIKRVAERERLERRLKEEAAALASIRNDAVAEAAFRRYLFLETDRAKIKAESEDALSLLYLMMPDWRWKACA